MCDRMCWVGHRMHACHDVYLCRPCTCGDGCCNSNRLVAAAAHVDSFACLLMKRSVGQAIIMCGGACVTGWTLHACYVVWMHPCDPYMQ